MDLQKNLADANLENDKLVKSTPTEEPCLTCEWTEEAKSEEEENKRKSVENYVRYITSTPEFKIKLEEELNKALDEGRI